MDTSGHAQVEELFGEKKPYSIIRTQLIILGFFPLSEAIAWTTIFPYIYSMVQSFSAPESSDHNIAIYAGIMVSVFTFGEFIMAPQWAQISNRLGRKPTLLIGSVGAIFSALLFGFSSSLPMAIAARTCAGLLNPNLGVVQTFVGELVSKDQQAKGFSVVPFLRGFGTIIGPVIGGYLAEPVKKYPHIFYEKSIWDQYPYLLPNVVVVLCLLASCILGFFCLGEVHPKFRAQPDIKYIWMNGIKNIFKGNSWNDNGGKYLSIAVEELDVELTEHQEIRTDDPEEPSEAPRSAFTRQIKLQIFSVAIQGFLKIATLAIVPIFLATPPQPKESSTSSRNLEVVQGLLQTKGGFGLNTTNISNVLLSQAVVAIASQILAVPAIISKQGPLLSYKIALFVLFCLYSVMPFTASWGSWAGLSSALVILWIYAVANGLATTCSAILITNTVPAPIHLASVNGAAASFGCLARTLGPAVSGPLFQVGLQTGYVGLPFWLLSAVTAVGGVVSLYLVDHP